VYEFGDVPNILVIVPPRLPFYYTRLLLIIVSAILHYRTFRNGKKQHLKNQHAICNGCIIIVILLAGFAALVSHLYASPPIANFYSLHSWMGVVTVVMFLFQVRRVYDTTLQFVFICTRLRGSETLWFFPRAVLRPKTRRKLPIVASRFSRSLWTSIFDNRNV